MSKKANISKNEFFCMYLNIQYILCIKGTQYTHELFHSRVDMQGRLHTYADDTLLRPVQKKTTFSFSYAELLKTPHAQCLSYSIFWPRSMIFPGLQTDQDSNINLHKQPSLPSKSRT